MCVSILLFIILVQSKTSAARRLSARHRLHRPDRSQTILFADRDAGPKTLLLVFQERQGVVWCAGCRCRVKSNCLTVCLEWQEDIYSRAPLLGFSKPTDFLHRMHVLYDPVKNAFTVRLVISFHRQTFNDFALGLAASMERTAREIRHYARGLRKGSTSGRRSPRLLRKARIETGNGYRCVVSFSVERMLIRKTRYTGALCARINGLVDGFSGSSGSRGAVPASIAPRSSPSDLRIKQPRLPA